MKTLGNNDQTAPTRLLVLVGPTGRLFFSSKILPKKSFRPLVHQAADRQVPLCPIRWLIFLKKVRQKDIGIRLRKEAMGAGQSRNSASRRAHHLTGNASYQEKTGSLKTVPGQAVVHMERVKLAPSQLQVGPGLTCE